MKSNIENPESRLASPGAGLPWLELQIARRMVANQMRSHTREAGNTLIREQEQALLGLVETCDPEKASRQVLIPRLRGMEDSSRFWSVWMTLEHLRIVNALIAETITLLGQGKTPQRKASTADVKPRTDVDGQVLSAFKESNRALLQAAANLPDLKTIVRHPHPWFGPFDAAQWHFMAGFHMRLHRRQVEEILRRSGRE